MRRPFLLVLESILSAKISAISRHSEHGEESSISGYRAMDSSLCSE